MENANRIADFLFEVGTLRRLLRIHRQLLLTDDTSDNIAAHSYRVTIIGWLLAKMEGVDPYKVVMMCLLHDMGEIRTGDHNWVHKRYVKIADDEIIEDQLGTLPYPDLFDFAKEYAARESAESRIAKDADLLDQILLLREYEWQGNNEAHIWLRGKGGQNGNAQMTMLFSNSAKELGKTLMEQSPSDWWNNIFTSENRK
jgi:putative hydrolases of HD superfamily